jgi:ADP-ribose pyrophosphatase
MREDKDINKHWKILNRITMFQGIWIDLNVDRILLPDGKEINYEALNYHHGGVGIVAENDEGNIILVKNYRYINEFAGWEIPAGTIPESQHHSDCIIQELKEEAGCEVKKRSLVYLGNFYPSIGSSNQLFHCYYVKGVTQSFKHQDTNEILETKWFKKSEIINMIVSGNIKDGLSLNLLMRVLIDGSS